MKLVLRRLLLSIGTSLLLLKEMPKLSGKFRYRLVNVDVSRVLPSILTLLRYEISERDEVSSIHFLNEILDGESLLCFIITYVSVP